MMPGKKRSGALLQTLPALLATVAMFILCLAFIDMTKMVMAKEDLDMVARKYLLRMETEGCLSSSGRAELQQTLADYGAENIDLTGSTLSEAGYGNAVYLEIQCTLPLEALNMAGGGMFDYVFEDAGFPVRIRMSSTAKY